MEQTEALKAEKQNIKKTIAFKFVIIILFILIALFAVMNILIFNSIKKKTLATAIDFSQTLAGSSAQALSYWTISHYSDSNTYTKSDVVLSGDVQIIADYIDGNFKLCG